MTTPARIFWSLHKQLRRLQAQENLRAFELQCLQNADKRKLETWWEKQVAVLGETVIEAKTFDAEGWNRLKQLAN